jgi:catechol 2,3-dioxygenase-like lactoylglutathione lyase family enzyme
MIKFHSSVIFVEDIERSKLFYTQVLDQKIEHDFGKNISLKCGLSLWEINKNHIINQKLKTNSADNKIELYFEAENLEHVLDKLNAEKVAFLHEIHEEPWGQRTMRFFDHDRHLIEIGEPLNVFIRNMRQNGLTVEEIEKKSGVPAATISSILAQ